MKRLFVVLFGFLLLVAAGALTGIIIWQGSLSEEEENPDWNVYQNKNYGFKFSYPKEFKFNEGTDQIRNVGTFFGESGESLATVALPEISYPDTNFQYAFLTISVSESVKDADVCRRFQRDGDNFARILSNEKIINETKFAWDETSGAAAGTMAETRIYHTLVKEKCFEISLNLFSSNIGNYEPGTVTEINKPEVWQRLEGILAALEFDQPGTIGEKTGKVPDFPDYPIPDIYEGALAEVDFSTKPEAEIFRGAIREGAKEGPNFSGKYTVVEWGCGTSCQNHAIIDAETGAIIEYGIPSSYSVSYRIDSGLFIVNPKENIPNLPDLIPLTTDYYVLEDAKLKMLMKVNLGEDEPSVCIQVITRAKNPLTEEEKDFPTPCDVPFGWEIIQP